MVTTANRSTGVLLTPGDVHRPKTRVVVERLERAGFTTRIVEQRLTRHTRRHDDSPSLALIGVDNPHTRQIISSAGWDLAVDVGLGGGPANYTGISLHTVTPDRRSEQISAWQHRPVTSGTGSSFPSAPAYTQAALEGHDVCGLVQLSERSVAASFVGVAAACIAVAEPLRLLAGGPATAHASYDLRDLRTRRAETVGEILQLPGVHASAV